MEKEKLQKITAICIAAITFTVIYYYWVISGIQFQAVAELNKQISTCQTRLKQGKENEAKLRFLRADATQDKPFLAAHEQHIVKGDPVAWLWAEMGDFAAAEKMNRLAIMPEGANTTGLPDNDVYERTGASFNLVCGYHKLGTFVQDIENAYSTFQIKQIEIVGGANISPDVQNVRVEFQLLALRDQPQTDAAMPAKVAQVPVRKTN